MKKSRGLKNELNISKSIHEADVAILVSPKILRERGIGQMDLVSFKIKSKRIILLEIKSSEVGIKASEAFQKRRLRNAQEFLSQIFGVEVQLSTIYKA